MVFKKGRYNPRKKNIKVSSAINSDFSAPGPSCSNSTIEELVAPSCIPLFVLDEAETPSSTPPYFIEESDAPSCIPQSIIEASDAPSCIPPSIIEESDAPSCIPPSIIEESDAPRCISPSITEESDAPSCKPQSIIEASDAPRCIPPSIIEESDAPRCIPPSTTEESDAPSCKPQSIIEASDAPSCIPPSIIEESDAPRCIPPSITEESDAPRCIPPSITEESDAPTYTPSSIIDESDAHGPHYTVTAPVIQISNHKHVSPDSFCSLVTTEDQVGPKLSSSAVATEELAAPDFSYSAGTADRSVANNTAGSVPTSAAATTSLRGQPTSSTIFNEYPVSSGNLFSAAEEAIVAATQSPPDQRTSPTIAEDPPFSDGAFSAAVTDEPMVSGSSIIRSIPVTTTPRQPTSSAVTEDPPFRDPAFSAAVTDEPIVSGSSITRSLPSTPSSNPPTSLAVTEDPRFPEGGFSAGSSIIRSISGTPSPNPPTSSAVTGDPRFPDGAFSAAVAVAEEPAVSDSSFIRSIPATMSPRQATSQTSFGKLDDFALGSLRFVTGFDRRRKKRRPQRLSLSTRTRRRRSSGKDWYKTSSAQMCENIFKRRRLSPNFRSTIRQRNEDYLTDMSKHRRKSEVKKRRYAYKFSSPFRRTKSRQAAELIKSKYRASSPLRRRMVERSKQSIKKRYEASSRYRQTVSKAAKKRYTEIVQSPSQLEARRKRQRECHAQRVSRKSNASQPKTKVEQAKKFLLDRRQRIRGKHGVTALPRPVKGTAEEAMQRLKKWKRHVVNYLLSFCLDNSQQMSWPERQEQYQSNKLKIVRLVEQILSYQREKRAQLYKYCNKINVIYNEAEAKLASSSTEQTSAVLREFYGVKQYHLKSHEAVGCAAADEDYVPFLEVFPDEAETCKSIFRQLRILVCDNGCEKFIPTKWQDHLHEKLKTLTFRRNIRQLLHNVYMFETCDKCDASEELCSAMDQCSDLINGLQSIAMHYSGIRSILVDLYRLRKVALDLHVIEVLLRGGTYQDFLVFKQEKFPDIEKLSSEDEDLCISADCYVMEKFGTLLAKFKATVEQSMEIHECCHCLRLFGVAQIHTYERTEPCAFLEKPSICATIKDYEEHHFKPLNTVILCNQCYKLLRGKNPQPSIYSYRNDMWPPPMPRQLQCLNAYEKQLISLCKSFQSIVKLYPMRYKGPSNTLVRAIKGLAVHVPLPGGTMKKVAEVITEGVTLPDLRNLLIQVDSMPNTKKMVIFRSLVDIGSVEEALHWLIANNPLYKNVKVAQSSFAEPLVRFTDDAKSNSQNNIAEGEPDECQREQAEEEALFDANFKVQPNKERQRKRRLSFFEGSDGLSGIGDTARGPGSYSSNLDVHATDAASANVKLPFSYTAPYMKYRRVDLEDPNSMLLPVQEDSVLEQYSLIPLEKQAPKDFALKTFGMKPVLAAPLAWDDPYLDVASFPHLFPQGCNGLFHQRTRTVKPAFFMENCFRISDPRFRRDLCYLFECAIRKDMMSICSQVYALLNCGKFGKVTAGQLKKGVKDPEKSATLEKNVSTMLSGIVATPQYWLKVRNNLEAVIQEHGPATFFVTLSCAEYKNEDFHRYLILRNSDLPNVKDTDPRHLLAADPVSVSRHFHKKFNALWDVVISDPSGPLGCVVRYYIRIEYQQRGAPHVHMLLWVRDAPTHGTSKPEHVLGFITKHITCAVPDATDSPLLHSLVLKNQYHRCSNTCIRTKSVKRVVYCRYCRFGFPRKSVDEAYLNSAEDVLASKVAGNRKNLYAIKRTSGETNVNDYNPALLLMWEANMDIQFINDSTMSLAYYTTGYVCKHEKQLVSDVAKTVNTNLTEAGMAQSMMCQMLRNRQMGAYEAADRVLRQPLYRMSDCVKTPSLFLPSELKRRPKPMKKIEELEEESTDVFSNNWQCQYYPKRPHDLESSSGYQLLKHYDIKYGKPKKENPLYVPELNIYFSRRRSPAVIRIWNIKKDDPESIERYCFMLLALFKTWRCYEDLLQDKEGNTVATYSEALDLIKDEEDELRDFLVARKRYDDLMKRINEIKLSAKNRLEAAVEGNGANVVHQTDASVMQAMDDELNQASEQIRSALTEDVVKASYAKLNAGQQFAYRKVMEGVEGSVSLSSNKSEPRRVFVSGVGGTGKSFLIKAIREELEFRYSRSNQPAVFVAAPTGVAAVNVEGVTVHKLLKLPVAKARQTEALYWPLHHEDVKMLWMLFRNCKLLIIDEVSMLSNLYLTIIHKRLNEILVDEDKDPKALFGNLNVLVLGDLLQLSPVNAPHVFTQMSQADVAKNFKSMGQNINLWRTFDFVELTENMRQRDDKIYADMLSRIRIGSPVSEDIDCLQKRMLAQEDKLEPQEILEVAVNKFLDLQRSDAYALCLMPRNDSVHQFNTRVLQLLDFQSIECSADDSVNHEIGVSAGRKKKKTPSDLSAFQKKVVGRLKLSETGGFEDNLIVAVGARVMLRRNLDLKNKLVNGSIGFVEKIDVDVDTTKAQTIYVRFQNVPHAVPVTRMTVKYCVGQGLFLNRTQFPLTLAYAITIHKCQGLSLNTAMIDIGQQAFVDGMAYVALSRVRKLQDLHLICFTGGLLKCDSRCVREYKRLYRTSGLQSSIAGYNTNPEFAKWNQRVTVSAQDVRHALDAQMEMEQNLTKVSSTAAPAYKPANAKSAKKIVHQMSQVSGQYLKLSNLDAHSCYANSAVQCLLRCHQMLQLLKSSNVANATAEALLSLVGHAESATTAPLSVDGLRISFGVRSQYRPSIRQDCDPVEFLTEVLLKLPSNVAGVFMHSVLYAGACPLCTNDNYPHPAIEQLVAIATRVDEDNYSLQKLFGANDVPPFRCSACNTFFDRFAFTPAYSFPPANRYMILNCPVTSGDWLVDKTMYGIREQGMPLFGERWNVIACVQISGMSAQTRSKGPKEFLSSTATRHYKTFVQHRGKEWILLNDTYQNIVQRKPVMKNMVLIILERQLPGQVQ